MWKKQRAVRLIRRESSQEIHLHALRQHRHQPLNSLAVVLGESFIYFETIFQPLQQNAFPRILLMRNESRLNLSHCLPVNRVRFKLIPELVPVLQALRTVDQVRIGNGIGCAGEQIGQTHLVTHPIRQHVEREIK